MKIELDNYSREIVEQAENITGCDYERKENYIKLEKLIAVIEDLEYEIRVLEEKIEDRERDIEDNYEQIPVSRQYGVCQYDR